MCTKSGSSARADVYSRITAEIIAAIEAGAGECRMPWHHDGASTARPTNVASGNRYRGINTLVLWAAAARAGYGQGLWGTYRAWHAVGAQVRRGERATTVVLWKLCGRPHNFQNTTIVAVSPWRTWQPRSVHWR